MTTVRYLVYDFLWKIFVKEADDDEDKISVGYIKTGENSSTPCQKDAYYDLFDLTDEKNEVASYMNAHHDEIYDMVSGRHDVYKLAAIVVKPEGNIEFAFFKNGDLCVDKVSLKRSLYPSFKFDQRLRHYEIRVEKRDEYNATVIEAKDRYKCVTGWQNGKACATIEKNVY